MYRWLQFQFEIIRALIGTLKQIRDPISVLFVFLLTAVSFMLLALFCFVCRVYDVGVLTSLRNLGFFTN
jgi:hypothetical protein